MTDTIKLGDTDAAVLTIQGRLRMQGYDVQTDCNFGPKTEAAVIQFQKDKGLIADGIVGHKTHAALMHGDVSHYLSDADIANAAELLGVDIATVHAVKAVESRGNGYLPDGRVVILFERHVMKKQLSKTGLTKERLDKLQETYPELINSKPGGYKGNATEHYRLHMASQIDEQSALESCSWGLFQIMGYHWHRLGFDSVDGFINAMKQSEGNQLAAFVQFILTDKTLHKALVEQDWEAFAKRYNGPGYKKNDYHTKLADAYQQYSEKVAA